MKSKRKFQIIHLSDLHVTSDALERASVKSWYKTLFEDIRQCVDKAPSLETFVVVSGDLTVSAEPSEFQAASVILERLLDAARTPMTNLVIVPGNHDISLRAPFRLRRDAFFRCAEQFMDRGESLAEPVRRFDELGVVFLTPGRTEEASESDVQRRWENIEYSLQAHEQGDELRVAVLHYPPRWVDQSTSLQTGDLQWLESVCAPFVERSRPSLVLHGHVHRTSSNFWSMRSKIGSLAVGAGPLSCETWRRLECGPPVYHIFTSSKKGFELRTRIYVAQSRRWLDERELGAEREASAIPDPPSTFPLLVSGERATPKQPEVVVVDHLCQISEFDLTSLTKDLGAAISDYAPMLESREEFAQRLVRYFTDADCLELLARHVSRFLGAEADRRLRVFFAAAGDGKEIASEAADLCSAYGLDTWLAERRLREGDDIEEVIFESIRTSDVFVVVVSPEASGSKWISKEIGIALQYGAASSRPRIIPLVLRGCEVPTALLGLQRIELDEGNRLGPRVMRDLLRAFRSEQLEGVLPDDW